MLLNDQAAVLRRLVAEHQQHVPRPLQLAIVGADVQCGAATVSRLAAASSALNAGVLAVSYVATGAAAFDDPRIQQADVVLLVATPDEDAIVDAFACCKQAAGNEMLAARTWLVAHRCYAETDVRLVLTTLVNSCQRMLAQQPAACVALGEADSVPGTIDISTLLARIVAAHASQNAERSRLAA